MLVMNGSNLKMLLQKRKKKSMLPRARISGSIWKFSIQWFSKHHCLIRMHGVVGELQVVVAEKEVPERHLVVRMGQRQTNEMVLRPQANSLNVIKMLLLEAALQER